MNTQTAIAAAPDVRPPSAPAPGTAADPTRRERFDEYTLIEKLGHGGMAEVFLGVSTGANGFRKLVAVKRLHAHVQADPDAVAMFEREANLAARLQHTNVVQTHKVGRDTGRHFMAMEYLDGQPLSALLRELRSHEGMLSAHLAARIAAEALEGLHYAHEASDYDGRWLRLVHRDVSPHNIFITTTGHVKLLDFGIAKAAVGGELTRSGLIKGKLSYIAPEQARGEQVDRRADVWSMGVTLWECLAGRRLFQGANEVETLRAALLEPVPPLSTAAPHVPPELSAIVERALARNPDERFDTALDFKLALDDWSASQSITGTRVSLSGLMASLFEGVALRRRHAICACLEQLQSEEDAAANLDAPGPATGAELRASFVGAPTLSPFKAVAIGAGIAAAALLAGVAMYMSFVPARVAPPRAAEALAVALGPGLEESDAAPPAATAVQVSPSLRDALLFEEPTAVELAPASEPARGRSATHRPRGERSPAASAPMPHEPAVDEAPIAPPAQAAARPGRLRLDSTPYSVVAEGGQRVGITPLDIELPAGTHLLTLRNPERGLSTTYRVTIPEGSVVDRRIALD